MEESATPFILYPAPGSYLCMYVVVVATQDFVNVLAFVIAIVVVAVVVESV